MRRAAGWALLGVLLLAAGAGAEDGVALAAAEQPRFVDGAPQLPHARTRLEEIRRRIQRAVVYPALAREREIEGTALVRFDIAHDGTPLDVVVHRSSGRPSLDRAAAAAVDAAAPLPWVYGRLEVPVLFSLESRR